MSHASVSGSLSFSLSTTHPSAMKTSFAAASTTASDGRLKLRVSALPAGPKAYGAPTCNSRVPLAAGSSLRMKRSCTCAGTRVEGVAREAGGGEDERAHVR